MRKQGSINLFLEKAFDFRDIGFLDDLIVVWVSVHPFFNRCIAGIDVNHHDIRQSCFHNLRFIPALRIDMIFRVVGTLWIVSIEGRVDEFLNMPTRDHRIRIVSDNLHVILELHPLHPLLHVIWKVHVCCSRFLTE